MRTMKHTTLALIIALAIGIAAACATEPGGAPNSNIASSPSPSVSPTPSTVSKAIPVTLPVLDALFSDEAFKSELKSKVELKDDELATIQKIASDEVSRLRQLNAEDQPSDQSTQAEQARQHAAEAIRGVIGEQKAEDLFALARVYWVKGGEGLETKSDKTGAKPEITAAAGPNGIPKDTRVVVNIPAFRMDVFQDGSLVKSYKIGIGYPEFPLPTGLRKAETIIFNPTWTPPDEPWVAGMKNISVGEKVEAGSKLNPLGPIKIPIGLPSLIHGGKSPAKIGTFASHGCVGLTSPQVEDFSKVLARVAGSEISDATIKSYLGNRAKTRVVKLDHTIPVELRYETIVLEDGQLHVYRDVYNQDTNTEENLRAVLEANGTKLEDLSEEERTQALEAVNAMSLHPLKTSKAAASDASAKVTPGSANANTEKTDKSGATARSKKPVKKNQKEVVIELAALKGKGYPAAVNLDSGTGRSAAATGVVKTGPTQVP